MVSGPSVGEVSKTTMKGKLTVSNKQFADFFEEKEAIGGRHVELQSIRSTKSNAQTNVIANRKYMRFTAKQNWSHAQ